MSDAWLWWLFIQMLGLACLPLTFSVFAHLPDRGWALSKTLGVLSFCFLVWFPLTLPSALPGALSALALPYSRTTILALLLLLLALNGWLLRSRWREIVGVARRHTGYILIGEALFAGAFALLIWIRSFIPDIYGTEKFMDEAFVSAIMRSPHLPPNDPWLSGYAINYYYFGHFIVATIAKLLGTAPAVAFNTGIALVFALMAVSLFGVTANVVALLRFHRLRQAGAPGRLNLLAAAPFGLAAVLLSLVFGNLDAASQWLAQLGVPLSFAGGALNALALALMGVCLFGLGWSVLALARAWRRAGRAGLSIGKIVSALAFGAATVAIFPWFVGRAAGMGAWLRVAWPQIGQWLGHSSLWINYNWWTPSRAVQSSPNNYQNITEFPAFSFLLADLHAHVLALPFTVLALGFALSLLLARGRGLAAFGATNGWRALTLVSGAVIVGSLYAMNGWDLPTYAGLALLCLAAQQWRAAGRRFSKRLAQDVFTLAAVWVILGVVLYLPFIRSFVSPSQGIGLIPPETQDAQGNVLPGALVPTDRTSFADLWSVFGLFFTILGAYLLWQGALALITRWRRAAQAIATRLNYHTDTDDEDHYGAPSGPLDAVLPLIMWALLAATLALVILYFVPYSLALVVCLVGVAACAALAYRRLDQPGLVFALMLAGTALAVVGTCEVVYLRDVFQFGELFRMNTIFKLYYQAWTLLSVGGAALLYELVGSGWRARREQLAPARRLTEQKATLRLAGAQVATSGASSGGLRPSEALAVAATTPEAPRGQQESGNVSTGAAHAGTVEQEVEAEGQSAGDSHSYSHEGLDSQNGRAREEDERADDRTLATEVAPGGAAAPQSLPEQAGKRERADEGAATGGQTVIRRDVALQGAASSRSPAPPTPAGTEARGTEDPTHVGTEAGGTGGRPHPWGEPALPAGLRVLGLGGKLVWMAGLLVLVLGALVYPVFATNARTGDYAQRVGIDGAQYLTTLYPGDAAAIRWINTHIDGDPVIVEATGGEYSDFARVSTFTGLPTVLGWGGHEYQWRVNWLSDPTHAADFNQRAADLDTIYTSPDQGQVMQLLQRYQARYLYVGTLEHQKYPKADLGRFAQFLQPVYQAEGVSIYAIP